MVLLRHLLVALLALTSVSALAQTSAPVSVEFTLYAPGVGKGKAVYLSGGTPSLGNWSPRGVRMDYRGNDTWYTVVVFSRPMAVQYRYTLGSDDRIAADERGQPLQPFAITAQRSLEVSDEVLEWTDQDTVVEARGQASGDIRYHRHVRGAGMPPRDLVVWLPRFYELRPKADYPVIYLNDGQDLFDPSTAEGGRDWGIDEIMQEMIDDELIEPMIVVGVFSGENRLQEYAPDQSGEGYMRYLVKVVKPLIDGRYRTRPGRQNALIGGAAMGGLIAFATAWEYPEVFGAAISMSPAFQVKGRIDALPWFAERADPMRPVFFYLDVGGAGADALLKPGVEAMVDQLKDWGYRPERNYVFVRDPDAGHGINAWAERYPEALSRAVRGARRVEAVVQQGSVSGPAALSDEPRAAGSTSAPVPGAR